MFQWTLAHFIVENLMMNELYAQYSLKGIKQIDVDGV
jgi:hypothetical protein